MRSLLRLYDLVIYGLAGIAGAIMALVFVLIVYDVTVRELGFQPPIWTSALSEFSLLYMTMLAAPWLVRVKGHVFVESLPLLFPRTVRVVLAKAIYVLCIALSLILFYYAVDAMILSVIRNEIEVRSFDTPRWILFASLSVGFLLVATEFVRYLVGIDSYYAGTATSRDGL